MSISMQVVERGVMLVREVVGADFEPPEPAKPRPELLKPTRQVLASVLDWCALRPDETEVTIEALCEQATGAGVHGVCVNPLWVQRASSLLEASHTRVISVVAFPLGANTTADKLSQISSALDDGATCVDVVCNLGAIAEGRLDLYYSELTQLVRAADPHPLRAVVESCLVTSSALLSAVTMLAELAGAQCIKTSTGFITVGRPDWQGNSQPKDVRTVAAVASESVGVKAAGGIRSYADACRFLRAGATHLGATLVPLLLAEAPE